ncbi:MAG: hypothetical protein AB8F74_09660 [Saprospiraceae bacterium]
MPSPQRKKQKVGGTTAKNDEEKHFFHPDEEMQELAKELKITLQEKPIRGRIAFNLSSKSGRSTKIAYNGKLTQLWKFLTMTGRTSEKFILLRNVPVECPSITVETCIQFVTYKLDYLKTRAEEEGDAFLKFEKKYVLDRNGNRIVLEGGWGQTGSDKSIDGFESALNSIYVLAGLDYEFQYPSVKSDGETEDRNTWCTGNPMDSPVYKDFLAKVKKQLSPMFVSQARDYLTPNEQLSTYQAILGKSMTDLTWIMVGVIFRVECASGFRIVDMTWGSLLAALTVLEPMSSELKSIGIKVFGKCENAEGSTRRGHLQQVFRNRNSKFVCAIESFLCWAALMRSYAVEFSENSYCFPCSAILQAMVAGKFTPGPIVKTTLDNNIDAKADESSINMVASKGWVNGKLQEIWKAVIPNYKGGSGVTERKLGTHTGRKTCIFNSLLMGQMSLNPQTREYTWGETSLKDLGDTIRMTIVTLETYYMSDTRNFIHNLREEDDTFTDFIDTFRPGKVKERGQARRNVGECFGFVPAESNPGSKSIFDYVSDQFPKMEGPIDYYRHMVGVQNMGQNTEAAKKEWLALKEWMHDVEYSTSIEFNQTMKSKFRSMVRKGDLVAGKRERINPFNSDKSAPRILKDKPAFVGRNRNYALSQMDKRDLLPATASIQKAQVEQNQNVHSNGNEGISEEDAFKIRGEIKASARTNDSASEVIAKLKYLRDNYDIMFEWYHLPKGKPMRQARNQRADSDFCKRVLKPILLCYEGNCLSTSNDQSAGDRTESADEAKARLLSFLAKNQNSDSKLVNEEKKKIFLTGWTKGCRCILNSSS